MNYSKLMLALYKSLLEVKYNWNESKYDEDELKDECEVLINIIDHDEIIREAILQSTVIKYYVKVKQIILKIIKGKISCNNYNESLQECLNILEELDEDFIKIDPDYKNYIMYKE